MTEFIAALPMYDWPEAPAEVDAEWAGIRDRLLAAGIEAPQGLVRRNADMPPVPGGIRDATGMFIAPDPAGLPPESLDLPTLWRHPLLLVAQTCWGPMETTGLATLVDVVAQPDYSRFEGGQGELYSSAIVMRSAGAADESGESSVINRLSGLRFAYNEAHSMSGYLALARDLEAAGSSPAIFAGLEETGSHRASMRAVAAGRADVCAIDCRTWALARRFEPASARLRAVAWTGLRKGLPLITRRRELAVRIAAALAD